MSRRRLARNFSWILTGIAARAGAQFLVLLLISRNSGVSVGGQYAYSLAVAAPVYLVAELGLRQIYLSGSTPPPLRPLLLLRMSATVVATVVCLVLASLQNVASTSIFIIVALLKAIDSVADIPLVYVQRWGAVEHVGLAAILSSSGVVTVVAVLGSLSTTAARTLFAAAIVSAGTQALFVALGLGCARKATRGLVPMRQEGQAGDGGLHVVLPLLRAGSGLGLAVALGAVVANVPIYLIAIFHGDAVVGVVAPLLYAVTAASLASSALAQALLPSLSDAVNAGGNSALRKLLRRRAVEVGTASCAASLVFATVALLALPHVRHHAYAALITPPEILLLALVVALVPLPGLYNAAGLVLGNYQTQVATNTAGLAAAASIGLYFVPQHPVAGALTALLGATATRLFVSYLQLRAFLLTPGDSTTRLDGTPS